MIMDDDVEGTCKEAVLACFKGISKVFLTVRFIVFMELTMLFGCIDYVGKVILNS
jgi:hypothetical protein